jgi:hypothetical protein
MLDFGFLGFTLGNNAWCEWAGLYADNPLIIDAFHFQMRSIQASREAM